MVLLSARVLALIGRKVPESNVQSDPFNIDGNSVQVHCGHSPQTKYPMSATCPHWTTPSFCLNTVKFFFGFLSFIIYEPTYPRLELHEFYKDQQPRLPLPGLGIANIPCASLWKGIPDSEKLFRNATWSSICLTGYGLIQICQA